MHRSLNNKGLLFNKKRGKLLAGVLLLHNNEPVHKSRVAQAAIREFKIRIVKPLVRPGPI